MEIQVSATEFIFDIDIVLGYPHPGCKEFGEPDCLFKVYLIDAMNDTIKRLNYDELKKYYKELEFKNERIYVWRLLKQMKGDN